MLGCIDRDGFIVGEGDRCVPEVSYPAVDIGYNAGVSLAALALYERLAACGLAYSLRYELGANSLKKTFLLSGLRAGDKAWLAEPIVFPEGSFIEMDAPAGAAMLSGPDGSARLVFKGIKLDMASSAIGFTPFPGCFFQPFRAQLVAAAGGKTAFEVSITVE